MTAAGLGMTLEVDGVAGVRADLRRFAPDLSRQVQRTLTSEARGVADAARARVPQVAASGWGRWQGDRLAWNPGRVAAGIRGTTARGRRRADGTVSVVLVEQRDPAGAVLEVSGRRTSGSGTGRSFISALNRSAGQPSRIVWRAAEAAAAGVAARVAAVTRAAERDLTARIAGGTL